MSAERDPKTLLDWPARSGTADLVMEELEHRSERRKRRRRAAGVVLALSAAIVLFAVKSAPTSEPATSAAALTVHAPLARVLSDGSRVEIKNGGRVADHFTPETRLVALEAGTAHFAVTRNPNRPFIVSAGDITVRAVGTAFSVSRTDAGVIVLVTEGRVSVESASSRKALAQVSAGAGISIPASESVQPVSASEMTAQLRWRTPTLELSSTPVSAVAKTLNRLNVTQIVVDDPNLADARLSGVIQADNVEAFLSVVRAEFQAKVERNGTIVRLSAGP